MDEAGVIAAYVLDGDRPLTAESSGNTTFYLYGLGAIGEETNAWSFTLPDGTHTPRQLSNDSGEITLSARYTPWGDTLELNGTGNFTFGYLGGVLDATTGLMYVGNGRYYDSETGRFLTRNVNPDSTNPYVPWNPIGAILGPLGLITLVFSRKKKGSKTGMFLVLLVVLGSVGMTLAACGPAPTPSPGSNNTAPAFPVQTQTPVPTNPGTVPSIPTGTLPAPIETPTAIPCPTPTLVPTLDLYGIDFDGTSWTLDEQAKILDAIQKIGEEFSRVMGLGQTSWDAFKTVYGNNFIFYRSQGGDTFCQGGPNKVTCSGNAPLSEISPARLLVHELGHALVQTRYGGSLAPYLSLGNAQIVDDYPESLGGPRWVTGTHSTLQQDPAKAGQFERTGRGYITTYPPDLYHGENWPDWQSNDSHKARNEDFADMFMNWAYNSFDYSPAAYNAGYKRFDFMESNMYAWITG